MILCFDIGGSTIKCASAACAGQLGPVRKAATPLHDFAAFGAAMAALMADAGAGEMPDGVAIAIAGVIDPADGRIKCANIPCIDGRTLAADLAAAFGLPVWIANDADCFALAEARSGAGVGHDCVFGLILGTGVGGGLVLGGRLLTGPGGFAGEWGHGPVAAHYAGTPPASIPRFACGCGQSGCLDTVGGARGIERLHKALHGADLDSGTIVASWLAGDAQAARTVDCWADLLSGPLAMLVNTVGADVLPAGGGLANARPLLDLLDRMLRERLLRKTAAPLVVPALCGTDAGLIGAAWLGFGALAGDAANG